ncbi:MAG: hypothetical protein N3G76_00880 [Candidatus Micrarchaeota archaeon]|nr:hypothetical protein [Candidatus Micrarchaeota archaeon]
MARRAIILDLFGVIVDNPHFLSYFLVPEFRGKPEHVEVRKMYFDVCEGRASERDLSALLASKRIDYESRIEYATTRMVEFIDQSLFSLEEVGDVFLYTHFYTRPLRAFLHKSKTDSVFKHVFCTDVLASTKEDGFPAVKRYLDNLGYVAEDAVVVDDTKSVIEAAKKSGFGITMQKITEPKRMDALGADFVISRLSQIKDVLPY